MKQNKTPFMATLLIRIFFPREDNYFLSGDFKEIYFHTLETEGLFAAWCWYWGQVLSSLPHFIIDSFFGRISMFSNYLKIALRTVRKQKVYSAINILGLAIGLASTILILLWVQNELSFDRFHKKGKNIYRVLRTFPDQQDYGVAGPGPLAAALKQEFPEIKNTARIFPNNRRPVRYEDKSFHLSVCGAESSFIDIFSFPFAIGDPQKAFSDPNFIILSEETATKYFGKENPIGKVMHFEWWSRWLEFHVTGVIKNVPENSHLQFDALIPFSFVTASGMTIDTWDAFAYHTYVQLEKNADLSSVNKNISGFLEKPNPKTGMLQLEPLTKIHLYNFYGGGPITYIYIFSTIGILILLIACINFMNLATAYSVNRAKEVGLRKVVGSRRKQLIFQFLGESVFLSLLALGLSMLLVFLLLPSVNTLLNKQLQLDFTSYSILIIIGISLLTGILSGSYPALVLSSFKPTAVLQRKSKIGFKGTLFRKILVTAQFAISVILIISAITIYNQLTFIKDKDLGYSKEHILNFRMGGSFYDKYETIKQELLQNPDILSVTQTNFSTTGGFGVSDVEWEGKDKTEQVSMSIRSVNFDFQKTFDVELLEGRFFSREYNTDVWRSFILNEKAIEMMEIESPINKGFSCQLPLVENDGNGKIIGVVKNFHYSSLHNEIEPLILVVHPWWYTDAYIKVRSQNISKTLAFVDSKLKEFVPEFPFEISFMEDKINNLYQVEQRAVVLIKYSTFLALFVACLGLFGLASFSTIQRTKEIGIRKVLGASVPGIVSMLSKEFTKLVLLANIVAWPLAYFVMDKWLQNFAYKTDISWFTFLSATITALLIAFLTVSYQSIKTAVSNPVNSLRYE